MIIPSATPSPRPRFEWVVWGRGVGTVLWETYPLDSDYPSGCRGQPRPQGQTQVPAGGEWAGRREHSKTLGNPEDRGREAPGGRSRLCCKTLHHLETQFPPPPPLKWNNEGYIKYYLWKYLPSTWCPECYHVLLFLNHKQCPEIFSQELQSPSPVLTLLGPSPLLCVCTSLDSLRSISIHATAVFPQPQPLQPRDFGPNSSISCTVICSIFEIHSHFSFALRTIRIHTIPQKENKRIKCALARIACLTGSC